MTISPLIPPEVAAECVRRLAPTIMAGQLQSAIIVTYLEQRGWGLCPKQPSHHPRSALFAKNGTQDECQLHVAVDESFRDYHYVAGRVIEDIAEAEGRTMYDVLLDLLAMQTSQGDNNGVET